MIHTQLPKVVEQNTTRSEELQAALSTLWFDGHTLQGPLAVDQIYNPMLLTRFE
jgi:hypothetical protein